MKKDDVKISIINFVFLRHCPEIVAENVSNRSDC